MKNRILFGLAAIFMVSGCTTPYDTEKSYWTGNRGFSQMQLENDVWQIDFTGNTHTNSEAREKYLLMKAALITIKESYSFFKVIQTDASKDITGSHISGDNTSNRARGRSKTPYIPTNTFTTVTVKLLNEKGDVERFVYDANLIVNSNIDQFEREIKGKKSRK